MTKLEGAVEGIIGKNRCGKAWKSGRKLFNMQCTAYKVDNQGVVISDFLHALH